MSSNSWTVEDSEYLDHLIEIANFHHAECISPLMAEEDRLEEEEALNTAMLAIAAFENCRTGFIESLEKAVSEDEDQQQNS